MIPLQVRSGVRRTSQDLASSISHRGTPDEIEFEFRRIGFESKRVGGLVLGGGATREDFLRFLRIGLIDSKSRSAKWTRNLANPVWPVPNTPLQQTNAPNIVYAF
jgi:hypothetical protein